MREARPQRSLPQEADHIARARNGDKEAFRYLVEGYQDRLFGLVFSMVSNREQAEDLIQEVFIKAYFALSSFEGQSSFYTWLYRIASNHCLDHLRKRRPLEVPLDKPLEEEGEVTFAESLEAPRRENPDNQVETPSEISGLLMTLDPDQRLILSLRELEGHSYEELTDMLKLPLNTVKSRLNRSREALKEAYIKKFGNIPEQKTVKKDGEIT